VETLFTPLSGHVAIAAFAPTGAKRLKIRAVVVKISVFLMFNTVTAPHGDTLPKAIFVKIFPRLRFIRSLTKKEDEYVLYG
jgi:hypothetical protein